jgi:SAM-dependent methyltransferase
MKNFDNLTILRELEYRELLNLSLSGRVIDLGGSSKAGYQELIGGNPEISTANINADYGCDLIFDLEKSFPVESASYDGALCFNVLEHVYEYANIIKETGRILKSGGKFIVISPFIYQVHGCPDDYFRFSESALRRMLSDTGFEVSEVKNLGFGVFSASFQMLDGTTIFRMTPWLRILLKKLAIRLDKSLMGLSKGYAGLSERVPLGYYVVAIKKSSDVQ